MINANSLGRKEIANWEKATKLEKILGLHSLKPGKILYILSTQPFEEQKIQNSPLYEVLEKDCSKIVAFKSFGKEEVMARLNDKEGVLQKGFANLKKENKNLSWDEKTSDWLANSLSKNNFDWTYMKKAISILSKRILELTVFEAKNDNEIKLDKDFLNQNLLPSLPKKKISATEHLYG